MAHFSRGKIAQKSRQPCTETETACWSNFWVEISWIFDCKLISDFYPEEIIKSLSLSDWFSPYGFFQGHWAKISEYCVIEWHADIYFLSVKNCSFSSVLKSENFMFISSTFIF